MGDESTKRAAQEYLASRLSEEGQSYEDQLNRETAISLAPAVWRQFTGTIIAKCQEWNSVTEEQTFTWKETVLGDIRILCAGRSQQMLVHYDSNKRSITIKNTARPEHEPDTLLHIEGHSTDSGREAHLVRNKQPVNPDMLLLGHLRMLAGLSRQLDG
jgi:hypothetical protein